MFILAFVRSAGIVQSFASRSISAHRAAEASEGPTRVRSCNTIRQRVVTERSDIAENASASVILLAEASACSIF